MDDSTDDIAFVRRALATNCPDAEFLAFRAGTEAIARLSDDRAEPRIALVLLDLKLPGLDGHAILAALRSRWSQGQLPIVVFSSSREASDVKRAYANGANSYVVKPLVFEEYTRVVGLTARYWLDLNVKTDDERDADA